MEGHPVKFKYSNKARIFAKKHTFLNLTDENSQISLNYSSSKIMKERHNLFKVIIEKWEIFMELELRFGMDLGRLALLKKKHLGRL